MEGELDAACIVSIGTEDALDGRVRREGVRASVLLFLIDAHHLEGERPYVHKLSDERSQLCIVHCVL